MYSSYEAMPLVTYVMWLILVDTNGDVGAHMDHPNVATAKEAGKGRARLTQCQCTTPHSWESFAETLTFKENIWGSLLQEINFMVFLTCIYKKLERIPSRQHWSAERPCSCFGFTNVLHVLFLKRKGEINGGKTTPKTLLPASKP